MKKFSIFLCLILACPLFTACSEREDVLDTIPPVIEVIPDSSEDFSGEDGEDDEENQNKDQTENDSAGNGDGGDGKDELDGFKKQTKKYATSTVNSLRVRSAPNTSSAVFGYLDKNDAVLIKGESGNFYITTYKEKTAYVYKTSCEILEIECENDKIESAIDLGSTLLGYPYIWGAQRYHWGNGKLNSNFKKGEFDCSALTLYVYYKSNNVILDVTTRTQVKNGVAVDKTDLKRGDLMFFTNADRKNKTGIERIGHVAIYFGNNYILHTASDHAVIEPISALRWSYYITSRRVV